MFKHNQSSIIAVSILLTSSVLSGCSGSSNDGGRSSAAAETPKTASRTAVATAPSPATPTPVGYTPEGIAGAVTTCNIENFDESLFRSVPTVALLSAAHRVSGWITAPQLTAPSFWLRLDDKAHNQYFQVPVTLSVKRPDVLSSAHNPAVPLLSGFSLALPSGAVPAGQYHLYLAAQTDGKTIVCDNGRQVDFK